MSKPNSELESLHALFAKKIGRPSIKPPAYQWQDLALRVIKELKVPNFKRSSVFQICKKYSQATIELALNDTKELCHDGEAWKYFFKIIGNRR